MQGQDSIPERTLLFFLVVSLNIALSPDKGNLLCSKKQMDWQHPGLHGKALWTDIAVSDQQFRFLN